MAILTHISIPQRVAMPTWRNRFRDGVMKCVCLLALALLPLTGRAQQNKFPTLDAQSADISAVPEFLAQFDSLTDDNLAAFFDQWASWSAAWGQSHINPICDSLCKTFWDYDRPWRHDTSCFVLPATVEISSYATDFTDLRDTVEPAAKGFYVPHLPGIAKVYYVTPQIQLLLMKYLRGPLMRNNFDIWNFREERADRIGEYIDTPIGLSRWRFESAPQLGPIGRYPNGTLLDYSTHGFAGDTYFQNDATGEFEWLLTWD